MCVQAAAGISEDRDSQWARMNARRDAQKMWRLLLASTLKQPLNLVPSQFLKKFSKQEACFFFSWCFSMQIISIALLFFFFKTSVRHDEQFVLLLFEVSAPNYTSSYTWHLEENCLWLQLTCKLSPFVRLFRPINQLLHALKKKTHWSELKCPPPFSFFWRFRLI